MGSRGVDHVVLTEVEDAPRVEAVVDGRAVAAGSPARLQERGLELPVELVVEFLPSCLIV